MIRLRSSPSDTEELLAQLNELLAEYPCESQLLRHGIYDGDLAALLIWHEGEPRPSREGTLLAERLRTHGSIDHAVWIPSSKRTCA